MRYSDGFAQSCEKQFEWEVILPDLDYEYGKEQFVDKAGKVGSRVVEKKIDKGDESLRAADFSLGNLMAAGAVGLLKPVNLAGSANRLDQADLYGEAIDYLDAMAPAVEEVVVEKE